MEICYMILAHNNFSHLDRLINALDRDNSTFFLHIDKKCKIKYENNKHNVIIIPEHIDIQWGAFSMIEATLLLMKYATKHGKKFDYFILLSGVDYPILPYENLQKILAKNKEFIDISAAPLPHKPMKRFEYYFIDKNKRNYFYSTKELIKLNRFTWRTFIERFLIKYSFKRKIPFDIYVGSQWFALTGKCIEYILKTVEEDKRYIKFFKRSFIPDEAFFQTIIGNSDFGNNTCTTLTYTDWDSPTPPANIEEKHIDLFKKEFSINKDNKNMIYFARKFNDQSDKITDRIDKELRNITNI